MAQLTSALITAVFDDLTLLGKLGVDWVAGGGGPPVTITVQPADHPIREFTLSDAGGLIDGVRRFATALQEYFTEIYGEPVPKCPHHGHARVAVAEAQEVRWSCPDGSWSCPLGSYRELTWPPDIDKDPGDVASALVTRLRRRGVSGVRQTSVSRRGGAWVASLGVWPMTEALVEKIRRAAAPVRAEIEPKDWPADAAQRGLDQRLAHDLEWARWAVDRWANFPVDGMPRRLVLTGPDQIIQGGFRSGDAKLAFHEGRVDASVPVPTSVLAALRLRPGADPPRPSESAALVVTAGTGRADPHGPLRRCRTIRGGVPDRRGGGVRAGRGCRPGGAGHRAARTPHRGRLPA